MAATVATPLEKSFSAIAGIDNITSSSGLGLHADHDAVRARPRCRRRRAGCERGDLRHARAAPAIDHSAVVPQSRIRRRRRFSFSRSPRTTCGCPISTKCAETTIAQRLSMVEGVAQVSGVRLAEVRGAHRARPRAAHGAQSEREPGGARRCARTTSRSPPACCTATTARSRCRPPGSSTTPTQFREHGRRRVQQCAGAPGRSRARVRRRAERQERELVQRRPCDRARGHAPAGHEHRRGCGCGEGGARGDRAVDPASRCS